MGATTVGLDLANRVFQVYGVNAEGTTATVPRHQRTRTLPSCEFICGE